MKTLTIIRHAKSSWDYPDLPDYDRPLNKRGQRNIQDMGKYLQKKGFSFVHIVSSPANRALTTAIGLSSYLGYNESDVRLYKALFHASERAILDVLKTQNDDVSNLLLFGHNPGLTDFINRHGDQPVDNIPTTGFVSLVFNTSRWTDLADSQGKVMDFYYPKGI